MKPHRFEKGSDLQITYRQPREGPANFLVYRPHVSQIALTRQEVLKAARWPARTPTGDALRQWLDEIESTKSLTVCNDGDATHHQNAQENRDTT